MAFGLAPWRYETFLRAPNGFRASGFQHQIEDRHTDGGFGGVWFE